MHEELDTHHKSDHKQSTPRVSEGLPAGAARLGRAALQNQACSGSGGYVRFPFPLPSSARLLKVSLYRRVSIEDCRNCGQKLKNQILEREGYEAPHPFQSVDVRRTGRCMHVRGA